jgi:hypothetical protein
VRQTLDRVAQVDAGREPGGDGAQRKRFGGLHLGYPLTAFKYSAAVRASMM